MGERRTAPTVPSGSTDGAEARLERLLQLQQLLFRVSRELGPALELQPVLHTALRGMQELVDFKGGSICLVEGDAIRLVVSDPPVSQEVLDLRLPVGQGLSGHVVATGEPLYSPDLLEDAKVEESVHQTGSNVTIRSWIGVPLVVLGEVIGLLQVDSAEPEAFDEIDLYVLEGLGVLVAGAIESARRHEAVVELERMKSDFIERVSHELRTPIAIIAGFSSMLNERDATLSDDERRSFMHRVSQASARLRYLVEEILTLSRVDSGPEGPAAADVELEEVVVRAAQSTGHPDEITVEIDPGLSVRTDPIMLERVIEPLLDNAVKYAGQARVRARREGRGVVIDVEDAGPGVPRELEDRMFERFSRGEHTLAGMGLGLPIARHFAGLLQASVNYESLDPGCRFRLEVPDLRVGRRSSP